MCVYSVDWLAGVRAGLNLLLFFPVAEGMAEVLYRDSRRMLPTSLPAREGAQHSLHEIGTLPFMFCQALSYTFNRTATRARHNSQCRGSAYDAKWKLLFLLSTQIGVGRGTFRYAFHPLHHFHSTSLLFSRFFLMLLPFKSHGHLLKTCSPA